MTAAKGRCAAVFGLGNLDRGDDAIGPLVACGVGARCTSDVAVLIGTSPLDLLDDAADIDLLVVVDAVRSPRAAPGTVTVRRLESLPHPAGGPGSSHGIPLYEAIRLAEALHRAPGRVLVVGVEAEQFATGSPLSPAVARALPVAVDTCLALLDGREASRHVPG